MTELLTKAAILASFLSPILAYLANVSSTNSVKLFNGIDTSSFIRDHFKSEPYNFDNAIYFRISLQYRRIGTDNSSMDLSLYLIANGIAHGINVGINSFEWTALEVVHRIPISSDMRNNILSDVYLVFDLEYLDFLYHTGVPLELSKSVSTEYLPQPMKIPSSDLVPSREMACNDQNCLVSHSRDQCELLGSANAVLLNYIGVAAEVISSTKVFCGIFSTEKNHQVQIKALKETWASQCTGFLVFSTVTDPTIPSVYVPHIGEESYRNMWQKIRNIWRYIHKHYRSEYDYFLLGGDDMYVLMNNLYHYLDSDEIENLRAKRRGVYLGRVFINPQTKIAFNSGGSGYVLDAVALETLVLNLDEPHCNPTESTSEEDTFIAMCLNASMNRIIPYNTSDALDRQRFHHFTPSFYVTYEPQYDPITGQGLDWYTWMDPFISSFNEPFDARCARLSVSFHSVYEWLMYAMHDYLFHCPIEKKRQYYREHGDNYYDNVDQPRISKTDR